MLSFVFISIAILLLISSTFAQDWRGLAPIVSTCQEVGRALGGDACGKKSADYELPDETVTFVFSHEGCNGRWPEQPYNVPTGTIVGISVLPKVSQRLTIAALKVDLAKFRKTAVSDMVGTFKYISDEDGMYFTALEEGQVLDITYVPPARFDNLRCQSSTESNPLDKLKMLGAPFIKIGSFDPASHKQEARLVYKLRQKLKEFAGQNDEAKGSGMIVYVIAYVRQGSESDEGKKIAERVRHRLVTEYKFDAGQIMVLNGGYRSETVVELFIQPSGAEEPKPTFTPRHN